MQSKNDNFYELLRTNDYQFDNDILFDNSYVKISEKKNLVQYLTTIHNVHNDKLLNRIIDNSYEVFDKLAIYKNNDAINIQVKIITNEIFDVDIIKNYLSYIDKKESSSLREKIINNLEFDLSILQNKKKNLINFIISDNNEQTLLTQSQLKDLEFFILNNLKNQISLINSDIEFLKKDQNNVIKDQIKKLEKVLQLAYAANIIDPLIVQDQITQNANLTYLSGSKVINAEIQNLKFELNSNEKNLNVLRKEEKLSELILKQNKPIIEILYYLGNEQLISKYNDLKDNLSFLLNFDPNNIINEDLLSLDNQILNLINLKNFVNSYELKSFHVRQESILNKSNVIEIVIIILLLSLFSSSLIFLLRK